ICRQRHRTIAAPPRPAWRAVAGAASDLGCATCRTMTARPPRPCRRSRGGRHGRSSGRRRTMPRSSCRLVDPQDHGSLEDIALHPQLGVLTLEATHISRIDPGALGLLATGEAILLHPVPQRAGPDAEVPGHLNNRLAGLADDRHRPGAELRVVLPPYLWHG